VRDLLERDRARQHRLAEQEGHATDISPATALATRAAAD